MARMAAPGVGPAPSVTALGCPMRLADPKLRHSLNPLSTEPQRVER